MLTSLLIQNFVLIDRLNIQFEDNFSVITGETGAGKSIILGALGLVLGQRADGKSIKDGADKCVIEAAFDITKYDLLPFFKENDLEYDSKICLFRRELYASGKSRAFVNDSPVSLSVMKELGGFLVDIHSQHQNLLLGDPLFQLKIVDLMSGNKALLQQYREEFSIYVSLGRELNSLKEKADQAKKEEDYIRFQLEQFDSARLRPDEQNELEQEQELLSHAEEIKNSLYKLHDCLNGDEQGVVRGLRDALSIVTSIGSYYPNAKEMEERLRSAYLDLNDLAADVEVQQEKIEYNPERMDFVNERLNLLYSLEQKHRVSSLDDLFEINDRFKIQLQEINSFDEQISGLEQQIKIRQVKLCDLANELSVSRKKTAEIISGKLIDLITPLGMPNARFQIRMTKKKQPDVNGIDDVCFLFTANKNGVLQPVADTASGGEISRLMLCLKAMIAGHTALPSILFDEVDTGVSGDIADKMGNIMSELGTKMQVLAITHLPQIAAKGKAHYLVYKQDSAEQTVTKIRRLDSDERVKEVARMLSGAVLTDAAIANARDLLGGEILKQRI
ncbi:MAG: DNA repair protein RecN [Massilibacteroides sp.]|nr:DNA repair protein RecN [Massilibacteroides sp.]MDD3062534.1 DNA repair protein RecN [Massilibacteroides sp.]MDD4115358.1 DNA repair protein RecN [Massilibacteroides sp.]MDD4659374.1 DNA repair protein RecN [Massilibacteroides sp.]